ncbi:MAG: amidase family protein, partial [Coriobacteriia bacterium]|nr:amidase family protein [Coriobacteriia bacterium]
EDAIVGLNILSGYDPADPTCLPGKVDFTPALQGSIKGMRIAYSPDLDVFPVDPKVAVVVEKALEAFRQAGATVERVSLGVSLADVESGERIGDTWARILGTFMVGLLDGLKQQGLDYLGDRRDEMPAEFIHWVERAQRLTPLDVYRDQSTRTTVYNTFQRVLNDYDLLVTPTMACPPVKNADDGNTLGPDTINGVPVKRLIGYCMTFFNNYSGHPAASVPAGLDADGLPVGRRSSVTATQTWTC